MNKSPLVVAIDGNNILHRSHHALSRSGLTREDGSPVWAIHGAVMTIAKIIQTCRPDCLIITMDSPGGSPARRKIHPEYKANRGAPAGNLLPQLFEFPLIMSNAGFSVASYSGWEADDLMASIANWSEDNSWRCEIITSDRDAYQLLSKTVIVRKPNLEIVNIDTLFEQYGVTPRQYLELAALRGEPGDNISGVPGVGIKTATKLIVGAGSIKALFDEPDRWSHLSPRGLSAVIENQYIIERNISIATLRRDLPVEIFIERGMLSSSPVDASIAFSKAGLRGAGISIENALKKLQND